MTKPLKIAILGFGNIGSGVDALAADTRNLLRQKNCPPVEVAHIIDVRKTGDARQHSLDEALADPDLFAVVETIGGTGAALDLTQQALRVGRHVITSNKQLVAEHGQRLQSLAQENGVQYRFEAAVGGGIPIIAPLLHCLTFNRITRVSGILNGTTNYILTRMLEEGLSFETCLARAQELGYAEPKPDADISGFDTCNKICILASMAFGHPFRTRDIHTTGIEQVTLPQLYQAHAKGRIIKLLGVAELSDEGTANLFVCPCELPISHPLAQVNDVNNGIFVTGHATGDVMFYGRGAGNMPTASAVLADVLACTADAPRPFWQGSEVKRVGSAPRCEFA